ncbi:MAG: hypothetical protein BroJett041_23110 [Candidatus Jettenia caeni]|nr:MAG: hypothetical protein BroJett041_23110 [Candidatus Jettenia caeni]GJQ44789.1 MAG: hypothetical protein JETCAE04_05430 [Candidatus Jettenia caeni]
MGYSSIIVVLFFFTGTRNNLPSNTILSTKIMEVDFLKNKGKIQYLNYKL